MENQRDASGGQFRSESTLLLGPPVYEPRTPWGPGWALLAVLGIVGLSIGAGLILHTVLGWDDVTGALPGRRDGAASQNEGLRFFAAWQIGVVVLTLLASMQFRGSIRDVLALRPAAGGWRTYVGAILIFFALQVGVSVVQYLTSQRDMYADLRPFVEMVRGPDWVLAAAVIGLGAPLSEELLFRGFLLSALARTRLGFWGAAVVATALWTSLHVGYTVVGILEVAIIGVYLSWLLWRTGSLWVPIFCHALYNSLIVLSLRLVDLPAAP